MPLAPDNLTVVSSGEIDLSIVMPVFRNAPFLEELHRRISNVVDDAGLTAELVFVNDACPEGSADVLEAIAQSDPRVSVISLDRNVGQQNAVLQGLAVTRGKQVVVLDADLQDPPEAIPRLLAELESESAAAFGYPFIDPIRDESRIPQIRSLAGGWKTASPRYRSVLQTIGVSSGREFLERSVDNG